MADFVRGANGSVIGIALEGHPDAAPDAPEPTTMIPIVPIPEHAIIGELPDVIEQSNELAQSRARVAELEAELSSRDTAATEQSAADAANARIAELEAELASRDTAGNAVSSAEVPTANAPAPAPDWSELAGGAGPGPVAPAPDPNA